MKKTWTILFYLLAFCGVSYFLWEYLHMPRAFIVSLIISLGIILLMVQQRSAYLKLVGVLLCSVHIMRLIGYIIPVYEHSPDIRVWYRSTPSLLSSNIGTSSGIYVTLESASESTAGSATLFTEGKPVYQGNRISVAGATSTETDRVMMTLWDGSFIELFPQTTLTIQTLSPDFSMLTGSRIGLVLERGIISATTSRKEVTLENRSVKAGEFQFSCRQCVISYSGSAGIIASPHSFTFTHSEGTKDTIGSGTYTFTGDLLRATTNSGIHQLLNESMRISADRHREYIRSRHAFISERRGGATDTSVLVRTLSKVKMAIIGLFDRTYREKYNNLALYEYMRGVSDTLPPEFAHQAPRHEFIQ